MTQNPGPCLLSAVSAAVPVGTSAGPAVRSAGAEASVADVLRLLKARLLSSLTDLTTAVNAAYSRNRRKVARLVVSCARICYEPTRSLLSLTEPSLYVLDSHSSLFVFRERKKEKKDILAFFKVTDIISCYLVA